ncbi:MULTISPECIES: Crp/Fnr family transcriptional regulator [unclassified Mesorhizobium]|uniref:Crp/Fnr family transcriptional regulator n=1 Tax=unclassified Mesorhizobium TaxID=325217 RepID=UPI000FD53FC6|nr:MULTISPECIES: Crp/Fnr family transcriptional regulator [unclassified Mesorhizobium]RUU97354.1 Crp/Fnr family transcriptional regulator [Mesorhizobium sp. M6A.T.Cr.TU.017.01.1.1]RVB79995.1 Crp/Fnr family transcriptional regulator [Mesorhizobium sp. M6A.T.Cr.TU.014.01.1.1]RWP52353.1 MAG: Crp/Fnr family transcriptional regulator [Mesorhizobium sp.]RWP70787.1 MAG: Crp/Fnr family transcriptional regulator [Mesorhizobium sp.]RWP81968.1 MAG: Crp/Fnr family transcriptional regulator [Mesorhizobium 
MFGKDLLVRMLDRRDTLPPDEIALIEALPVRPVTFRPDEEVVREGSRPAESCLVANGFAVRNQAIRDKRQITAIHVPGDFVDLHSLLLKVMDHSVSALGSCDVVFIRHKDLLAAMGESPHLTRMLWLSTTIDASIQRTWITCLGRRSAKQHLAHVICELYVRLEIVGLASDQTFAIPLTQAELGDVLGLSVVHVNRTLQELRANDLLSWKDRRIVILDFQRLALLADFDATYLNLFHEPR